MLNIKKKIRLMNDVLDQIAILFLDVALVSPVMRPSPSQNSIRKVTPG